MRRYEDAGFLFLGLQILFVFANVANGIDGIYFWYCNHVLGLFSLAFFLKQDQFVKGLISVGLLPQTVWILDVLTYMFTGSFLFGFSSYILDMHSVFWVAMSLASHICSSFLALFFVYDRVTTPKSLLVSATYLYFLYVFTLFFTDIGDNINCVFGLCGLENTVFIPFYVYVWPLGVFVMFVLPVFWMQRWLSRKKA